MMVSCRARENLNGESQRTAKHTPKPFTLVSLLKVTRKKNFYKFGIADVYFFRIDADDGPLNIM